MKKIISIILVSACFLTGCSNNPSNIQESIPITKIEGSVNISSSSVEVEKSQTVPTSKENTSKLIAVSANEYDANVEKNDYYGVPVIIDGENYSIPTLKMSNFYFISSSALSDLYGISVEIGIDSVKIGNGQKIDVSKFEKGTLGKEIIKDESTSIISDSEKTNNLAVKFRNEYFIPLITLNTYVEDKLYIDRSRGGITNQKPATENLSETNNYLLRKRIIVGESHELVVKDSFLGKMLVLNDVFGASLDITPNNTTTFSQGYKNIFLHKTEAKTLMFGVLPQSVEVFEVNISDELKIAINQVGFIQKEVENIYFIKDKYLAISKKDIFSIGIDEESVFEVNVDGIKGIIETTGSLTIIDKIPYAVVKDFEGLKVYRFDPTNYKFSFIKNISEEMTFTDAPENFFYSHSERNKLSVYAMDDTGFINQILYDINDDLVEVTKSPYLRMFYIESPYLVDFKIDLAETTETNKESELYLNINGVDMGARTLVYGVEDDWVYCTEFDDTTNYSLRYNAVTGARDYSN